MTPKWQKVLFFFAILVSLASIGTILSSPSFLKKRAFAQEFCKDEKLQTQCQDVCKVEFAQCRLLCETEYCQTRCKDVSEECFENCPCEATSTMKITTTTTTTTTKADTTASNTCEKYFGELTGELPEQNCPTSVTGKDCDCPAIFERQQDESGNFMKADYATAHNHCESKQGYLAFFLNSDEFDNYKDNYRVNTDQEYIGYWSCDHQNFKTVDGDEASFTDWDETVPSYQGENQFCGVLRPNGKMDNARCDRRLEFSCRLPQVCLSTDTCEEYFCHYGKICNDQVGHRKLERSECPTSYSGENCECGPVFVPQTDAVGNIIKADYATANKICRRQGGFLAFILDRKEYKDYLSSVDFSKFEGDAFNYATEYFGYHSCELPTFYTDAGKEAEWIHENWKEGEPNNLHGIEYCVVNTRWKTFNDYKCTENLPFACRFSKNC
ncbi:Oidioi.mRNA.OKI2018_I69.chr2.g4572.t1.cds [Oikopleura dioica]|uniref:Oidioi.mRNA.OKI2018_I69.chr2.g4572.t1.cds n=1 Tax=Oikopleura dioica TaxID=34765 RepID=A0ABN7T1K5_OIKDI|nr:Oidioi.mRNA.OKI2018_I69.chr2.g4572.t1.cds [Oikopleura dioica]